MKTKTKTEQIKKEREFKIENELKNEFGSVYNNDFLDEEALALAGEEDEWYC